MASRSVAGTLALDWFASTSRRIDKLDAEQQRLVNDKVEFQRELTAAQQNGGNDSASDDTSSTIEYATLPQSLIDAQSLPSRKELLRVLHELKQSKTVASQSATGGQQSPPTQSVQVARVAYATYALALQGLFDEAERLQDATWYWRNIEDSTWGTSLYLLQTLPARLVLLGQEGYSTLKETTQRVQSSSSSSPPPINRETLLQTFRQLRKTPDVVIGALWPHSTSGDNDDEDGDGHKRTAARPVTASSIQSNLRGKGGKALASPLVLLSKAKRLSPLSLTLHEARSKRVLLTKRRDKVAEQLGALTVAALNHQNASEEPTAQDVDRQVGELVAKLHSVLLPSSSETQSVEPGLLHDSLIDLLTSQSPALSPADVINAPVGLSPPSRLSLIWPRLIVYPAILLYSLRLASNNRDFIRQTIADGKETIKGFFTNWVISPVKDLLDTIRGGDMKEEAGGIVTKEGRKADLESLERMVTQYAIEKGQISSDDAARAESLRRKVREGDLDVVMRAYEDQLKSPLKSLTVGSLPRLLLIQVQKAKYDLAVAMSGIDHLLQSQALLFGAVGIAPAMGIIWLGFKGGKWLVRGRERDNGREKERAWESMRRVDRILTGKNADSLSAKSYGHLLLELASLRRIASDLIPSSSHRRSHTSKRRARARAQSQGRLADFIQDVRDLEAISGGGGGDAQQHGAGAADTITTYSSRKAAVERMWRCWSPLFVVQL